MKKLFLSALCVAMLLVSIGGIMVNAGTDAQNLTGNSNILPKLEKIKQKEHYKKLLQFKKEEEFNTYIDNLTTNQLLTAIAEVSEETDDYTALVPFATHSKKIVKDLSVNDAISMLNNKDYSNNFKYYLLDVINTYKKYAKQDMKAFASDEKKYDTQLRELIKDKKVDTSLQIKALYCIESYEKSDAPMLLSILDSKDYSDDLKGHVLSKLEKLDKKSTFTQAETIVKSPLAHSKSLLFRALEVMDDIDDDSDQVVESVNNVLHAFDKAGQLDADTANSIMWSFGKIKNAKSVRSLMDNRDVIGDELVAIFVNMNFTAINKMLNANESKENLEAALECVSIRPMKEFESSLKDLIENCNDENYKEKAISALNKVQESDLKRNPKWDDYK